MTNVIIKLDNVEKIYQIGEVEVPALKGVNLEVKQGEFLMVFGPSGSGKSTMLNSIGCLDVPTKGNIYLDKHNIAHLSESTLAQIRGKKIGFVFQQYNLIPSLTAIENVMLPMLFQDTTEQHRKKRATELLKKVGLGERLDHLPSQLSGGESQRVAIARALANDPEVILADEPTGNLDSQSGVNVMETLKKLHKEEKKTIIMITHDPDLTKYAERIAYLKDGQVIKIVQKKR